MKLDLQYLYVLKKRIRLKINELSKKIWIYSLIWKNQLMLDRHFVWTVQCTYFQGVRLVYLLCTWETTWMRRKLTLAWIQPSTRTKYLLTRYKMLRFPNFIQIKKSLKWHRGLVFALIVTFFSFFYLNATNFLDKVNNDVVFLPRIFW